MNTQTPFQRAVAIVGTQTAMAERLGVSHQFINQICQGIKKLPPKDVLTVEKATGGKVTRHELRPDIFGEAE